MFHSSSGASGGRLDDFESAVRELLEADVVKGGGVVGCGGLVGPNGLSILPESELDWLIMRLAATYIPDNNDTSTTTPAKGGGGDSSGNVCGGVVVAGNKSVVVGGEEQREQLLAVLSEQTSTSPTPPPTISVCQSLPSVSLFSRDAATPPTQQQQQQQQQAIPSSATSSFAPANMRQQTLCGMLVSLHSEYSSFASQFHCMILDTEKGKAAVGYLGNGSMVLCIWCSPVCTLGTIVSKFYTVHTNISHVFKDLYWNN
eukprot:GHVS01020518.1.p1 GENE.GHVS01020518.1~~GHVS01020518.1.p1  ORF type:complete len:285 (+),score=90.62 GHVS01020518.1:82-855(+)